MKSGGGLVARRQERLYTYSVRVRLPASPLPWKCKRPARAGQCQERLYIKQFTKMNGEMQQAATNRAAQHRAMADVNEVKRAAAGRWGEILSTIGGLSPDILDGRHHPCPKCGGKDRFRLIDPEAGAVLCNGCFSKGNGDGIAALQWATGRPFVLVVKLVADHLGLPNGDGRAEQDADRSEGEEGRLGEGHGQDQARQR